MGRSKPLLPVGPDGEKKLLQQVIEEALASALDEVVVVLGCEGERVREALGLPERGALRAILHAGWASGQSGSLAAGLRAVDPRADAAAVLLGDQPGVRAGLIDRVLAALPGCERPIHRPLHPPEPHDAAAADGRRLPGHPVILARRIWPEACRLTGDEGARALLRDHPDWLCPVEVDEPRPPDVDTPADHRRLTTPAQRPA